MPLDQSIDSADQEQKDYILDLFAHVSQNQERIDRRVLGAKRGLTRTKSNQTFNFWLKAGLIEGDQFGAVWLNERGLAAVKQYHLQHK